MSSQKILLYDEANIEKNNRGLIYHLF